VRIAVLEPVQSLPPEGANKKNANWHNLNAAESVRFSAAFKLFDF